MCVGGSEFAGSTCAGSCAGSCAGTVSSSIRAGPLDRISRGIRVESGGSQDMACLKKKSRGVRPEKLTGNDGSPDTSVAIQVWLCWQVPDVRWRDVIKNKPWKYLHSPL